MKNFSLNDIIESISVLEHVVNNSELLTELTHDQRVALFKAAGTISRPTKEEIKKRDKDVKIFRQKQQIEQNRLKRAMLKFLKIILHIRNCLCHGHLQWVSNTKCAKLVDVMNSLNYIFWSYCPTNFPSS